MPIRLQRKTEASWRQTLEDGLKNSDFERTGNHGRFLGRTDTCALEGSRSLMAGRAEPHQTQQAPEDSNHKYLCTSKSPAGALVPCLRTARVLGPSRGLSNVRAVLCGGHRLSSWKHLAAGGKEATGQTTGNWATEPEPSSPSSPLQRILSFLISKTS